MTACKLTSPQCREGPLICGRHVVVGWSIKSQGKSKDTTYEISFRRLENQASMDAVLRRPSADEVEDYKEYKRIRQAVRNAHNEAARPEPAGPTPVLTVSGDGASGELIDRSDSIFE